MKAARVPRAGCSVSCRRSGSPQSVNACSMAAPSCLLRALPLL
jgi:hypothetical protein